MVLVDPTICVYQFIFDKNDSNYTNIIQYFIMRGLGLCIKLNSYVAHIFYTYSFIHNTLLPISIRHNKYYLYLNTYAIFNWGAGNSNKT